MDIKIRILSQLAAQCKSDFKVENKYDAVEKTLCAKETDQKSHKKSCTKIECISFGTKKIIEYWSQQLQTDQLDTQSGEESQKLEMGNKLLRSCLLHMKRQQT